MLKLTGRDEVVAHAGQELGVSDWLSVPQSDIDKFADVTGDHQFIHVDVERARATPFGGTVAHGFYTLSLAPRLLWEFFSLDGFLFLVNYGLNRVRYPAPLPVGSRVRMRALLTGVEEVTGGLQLVLALTFEREGAEKPVCVAEWLVRAYGG